ncbi:MAG: hypothetical protein LUF33_08890 [Clostridiales bacterium]|nr:hypothetical protein [Clostridiales bacterium]
MKSRGNPVKAIKYAVSFLLVSTALFCICRRLPECFASQDPAALAAALTLADGTYKYEAEQQTSAVKETTAAVSSDAAAADEQEDLEETEAEERDKTDYYDSYSEHDGEEKYVIEEKTYGADGVKCGSAYVKNKNRT